jgi:cysteine-rich repeat protein
MGGWPTVLLALLLAAMPAGFAFAECGDTVVDPGEDCDDGNALRGDCCLPDCRFAPPEAPCGSEDLCDAVMLGMCDGAGVCIADQNLCFSSTWCGSRLDLRDEAGTAGDRFRLKSLTSRFGSFSFGVTPERIGNPASDTRYAICGYDRYVWEADAVATFRIEFAPHPAWEAVDGGFALRNGDRDPLRRAAVTDKRLRIVAEGAALMLPGPVSASEYFNPVPRLYFVSDAGLCVPIAYDARKNTPTQVGTKSRCFAD